MASGRGCFPSRGTSKVNEISRSALFFVGLSKYIVKPRTWIMKNFFIIVFVHRRLHVMHISFACISPLRVERLYGSFVFWPENAFSPDCSLFCSSVASTSSSKKSSKFSSGVQSCTSSSSKPSFSYSDTSSSIRRSAASSAV